MFYCWLISLLKKEVKHVRYYYKCLINSDIVTDAVDPERDWIDHEWFEQYCSDCTFQCSHQGRRNFEILDA